MRAIETIFVHCSATPPDVDVSIDDMRFLHTAPREKITEGVWAELGERFDLAFIGCNWSDVGYHEYIRRDGRVQDGRPLERAGAHARGHNDHSIAICLEGGVDFNGEPDSNFVYWQLVKLHARLQYYTNVYPDAVVLAHRDISPDLDGDGSIDANERIKECPCFDVKAFWNNGD